MNFRFTSQAARRAAIETAQDLISLLAIIGAALTVAFYTGAL